MTNPVPSSNQMMQTLNAQWYLAVVTALNLDQQTFQLVQGSETLPDNDSDLWRLFDAIPPLSLTHQLDASQFNSFYDAYSAVVDALLIPDNPAFKRAIGEDLAAWDAFRKAYDPVKYAAQGELAVFTAWAQQNMDDPGRVTAATAALQSALNNPLVLAKAAAVNPKNLDSNGRPIYQPGYDDLDDAETDGTGKSFSLNTASASSDLSQTWASGHQVISVFDFFTDTNASYSAARQKFTSGSLNIQVTFQRVQTVPVRPGGWFDSEALSTAYSTQDNTLWPAGGHPSWDDTFGPDGNLQRLVDSVIVVDGVTVVVSTTSTFDTAEQSQLTAENETGVFPFYWHSAQGGSSSSATFDAAGAASITSTSPLGHPIVLGVSVTPIKAALGH